MGVVGAVIGFVVGFLIGQLMLGALFSGGRHLIVAENPNLKFWAGLLALFVSFVGAYVGYQIGT